MERTFYFLPLLALVACGTKDSDDTSGGTDSNDSGGGDSCEVTVPSTIPTSGATNANYRSDIEFHLSAADATAQIDAGGIAGTQMVSSDGKTVYWHLSAALAPMTAYTVTLNYCGGSVPLSFTTSNVGEPTSGSLVGNTYAIDLTLANIVEPPGIGSVLGAYLTTDILLGVMSESGTDMQMLGALAVEGATTQDYCSPSIDFPPADWQNPYFQIGPQDTNFSVAGYDIAVQGLNITGSFAPDGSYVDGATLSGTIDTRPLAGLVDDSGNEGAICELAVNFGATCEACPSDGGMFCLTLVANQISADKVSGALVVVAGSDCEGCESGPPAEDAVCAG